VQDATEASHEAPWYPARPSRRAFGQLEVNPEDGSVPLNWFATTAVFILNIRARALRSGRETCGALGTTTRKQWAE